MFIACEDSVAGGEGFDGAGDVADDLECGGEAAAAEGLEAEGMEVGDAEGDLGFGISDWGAGIEGLRALKMA